MFRPLSEETGTPGADGKLAIPSAQTNEDNAQEPLSCRHSTYLEWFISVRIETFCQLRTKNYFNLTGFRDCSRIFQNFKLDSAESANT